LNNTEESSVDKKWNEIKKAVGESAKEIIGEQKTRNEGWFDEECEMVIKQKNLDQQIMFQRETRQNWERYKGSRRKSKSCEVRRNNI
jgi:hypothetical protein